MKKMRKLIPAFCMLLLSAVMLSTSTFAWFSMNTTVTASGMQLSAKTDNAYLIIKQGTSLSGNATTATSEVNASLYPVKPVTTLTSTNIGTVTSWGTAKSTDPNDANISASVTALDESATLSNYVAKESFMVGILAGSGEATHDLVLASLTISDLNEGITVVVVCGTNVYSHDANVASGSEKLADASAVTTTGVQVDVYFYIDGSNENVKTANAANLGGSIELKFSIAG